MAQPGILLSPPHEGPDPRLYQGAVLVTLIAYGTFFLAFDIRPAIAVTLLAACQAAQFAGSRLCGIRYDPKSALITSLSLTLLLRTGEPWVAVLAACAAIGGKFLLRANGKHVFNPSALGLAAALFSGHGWIAVGQWGNTTVFAFMVASAGAWVVRSTGRWDVTAAFVAAYLGGLFGRALWLGDPLVIPLHQAVSGTLVLFAFYMISDPRAIPDSRSGRILFGVLVAAGALIARFGLYNQDGLLWSLVLVSLLTPVLDRLLPGSRFRWSGHFGRVSMKRRFVTAAT